MNPCAGVTPPPLRHTTNVYRVRVGDRWAGQGRENSPRRLWVRGRGWRKGKAEVRKVEYRKEGKRKGRKE